MLKVRDIKVILITMVICFFLFFPWQRQVYGSDTVVYASLIYKIAVWKGAGGEQSADIYFFKSSHELYHEIMEKRIGKIEFDP